MDLLLETKRALPLEIKLALLLKTKLALLLVVVIHLVVAHPLLDSLRLALAQRQMVALLLADSQH